MLRKLLSLAVVLLAPLVLPLSSLAIGLRGRLPMLIALFVSFQVSPVTATLTSTDPDTPGAANTGTARWSNLVGALPNTWTVSVSAGATQPTNCPLVPLSAFRIACTSVTSTGINAPTYSCGSPVLLSTAPQVLASGTDGAVLNALASHTVNFSINFADSWQYPASALSCSVPLTYTLEAH